MPHVRLQTLIDRLEALPPGMDGFYTVKYRGRNASPADDAENAVAALKAGAFDYLAKPVSILQLREALGRSDEKT